MIPLTTYHPVDAYRSHDIELTTWYERHELHHVFVPGVMRGRFV